MVPADEYVKLLIEKLKRVISGNQPPEDPYSYVGAPLKPRRPNLSAATAVEKPAE
jgi:hypothetical protein